MPSVAKRGVNKTVEGTAKRIAKLRALPVTGNSVELYDPDRPLTPKMRDFVRFWAEGESISSAAVRAGYSDGGSMAYKLARDPAILKIYNAEKAAYEEAAQMTRKKVMDMLIESYEYAKIVSEPSSMVAAAREIGKMCGYYEPIKKTLNINVNGTGIFGRLDKMSDAQLLEMIENDPNIIDVVAREVQEIESDDQTT